MIGPRNAVRAMLAAVLLVGSVGAFAAPASVAEFTDAHDGTASFTASQYGSGGGGGGGGGGAVTANAGGPYSVDEGNGNSVTLDGSGSSTSQGNLNGGRAGYEWTLVSGPGSLQQPTTQETVTYNPPANVDGDATVSVELTVTNNKGDSNTDTTTITVNDIG